MGNKRIKNRIKIEFSNWNWWQAGGFIAIVIFACKGEMIDFIELLNRIKNLWSG